VQAAELVILDVAPGAAMESQSGLQTNFPRIYGALAGPRRGRAGAIFMHPASNLMAHYLLEPLGRRGIGALGLNSRYAGNDSVLIMERVIQDLGAGVAFMRERFDLVFLVGYSGGAALTAFYQSQAEHLTITDTPAGDPILISPADLPPVDGIVLMGGHPGRSRLMLNWLDASVTDENDLLARDPTLDIYDSANPAPFSADFVARVRAAQRQRSDRITNWARQRLAQLRALPDGPRDEAFLVHRTYADPRFVDLALDANDRKLGGNRADNPRQLNYGVNNLGRYTSLTSWLSQWSLGSRADGPTNMALTSIPVLQLDFTADGSVFPSDIREWSTAIAANGRSGREEFHRIEKGNHFLKAQPHLIDLVSDLTQGWCEKLPQYRRAA
jgi:hypothetical protein